MTRCAVPTGRWPPVAPGSCSSQRRVVPRALVAGPGGGGGARGAAAGVRGPRACVSVCAHVHVCAHPRGPRACACTCAGRRRGRGCSLHEGSGQDAPVWAPPELPRAPGEAPKPQWPLLAVVGGGRAGEMPRGWLTHLSVDGPSPSPAQSAARGPRAHLGPRRAKGRLSSLAGCFGDLAGCGTLAAPAQAGVWDSASPPALPTLRSTSPEYGGAESLLLTSPPLSLGGTPQPPTHPTPSWAPAALGHSQRPPQESATLGQWPRASLGPPRPLPALRVTHRVAGRPGLAVRVWPVSASSGPPPNSWGWGWSSPAPDTPSPFARAAMALRMSCSQKTVSRGWSVRLGASELGPEGPLSVSRPRPPSRSPSPSPARPG